MLQCTYHGWKFDTDSACTSVPQAESPQQDYQAAAHLKATVYLSQVSLQLIQPIMHNKNILVVTFS